MARSPAAFNRGSEFDALEDDTNLQVSSCVIEGITVLRVRSKREQFRGYAHKTNTVNVIHFKMG